MWSRIELRSKVGGKKRGRGEVAKITNETTARGLTFSTPKSLIKLKEKKMMIDLIPDHSTCDTLTKRRELAGETTDGGASKMFGKSGTDMHRGIPMTQSRFVRGEEARDNKALAQKKGNRGASIDFEQERDSLLGGVKKKAAWSGLVGFGES